MPLVEEGWTEGEVAERTVAYYLESLKQSGIDTLLLGCTHYPLLSALFARVLGAGVRLVDSATATAAAVRKRLGALEPGAAQPGAARRVSSSPKCPTVSSGWGGASWDRRSIRRADRALKIER